MKQSLAEGYYEWNRPDLCREHLRVVEKAARNRQIPGLLVPLRITESRLHAAEGRINLASEIVAAELTSSSPAPWIDVLRAYQIRLLVLQGRITEADRLIADLGLTAQDRPTFNREYEYVSLVRLLRIQRREKEALRLLEVLKPQSKRERLLSSVAEISILQALLEQQRGLEGAALSYLHEALVLGEPTGYIRSFLDEGPAMAELLASYLEHRRKAGSASLWTDVSEPYVRKLLQLFPGQELPSANHARATIYAISGSEQILLRLIARGATNKQIASTLHLTEGTVKVYLSRLYEKMGVVSRTQALIAAQELKLLD